LDDSTRSLAYQRPTAAGTFVLFSFSTEVLNYRALRKTRRV
jgi:hypothetical protein